MRPSEALEKNRDKILKIIARYPVSNPRIFGSVARGDDSEGSDLDILVDHEGTVSTFDLAGLEIELEAVLLTPVDIQTLAGFSGEVAKRVSKDLKSVR